MSRAADLSGQRFGRLTALRDVGRRGRRRLWHCRCECGSVTTVVGSDLRSGNTQSCGCLQRERTRVASTTHGFASRNRAHRPYRTWKGMWERCTNPNHVAFARYGGRGIKVCDRWKSFPAFLADMGEKPSPQHTLDRVDNDGPYSLANCRWATPSEQSKNQRVRRGTPRPGVAAANRRRAAV